MVEDLPPPLSAAPSLTPVPPPPGSPDAAPAAAPAKTPPPVAVLDFLDPASRARVVPLRHPFRLDGAEVREVTIRRLATAEVAAWREGVAGDADDYDLYALMTGLPSPVLRGLDGDDGAEVVAAAYDFLPLWLRTATVSEPTTASGAASPQT